MGVSEQATNPDAAEIRRHLEHITSRWGELDQRVNFELRFLTADDRAQVKNVARFSPDEMGIDLAVDHIAAMNEHRLNAYVVVNPIDANAKIETGKAATDDDIVASFFHWADADDATAAENIRSFVGPKPTFFVLTGVNPSPRPHVYWELEEPTHNLQAWTATQRAIAATLKTDSTVVNPSRIMRIGGTINWPKPQKQAKGYIAERTTLRIYDEDERPLVTSERMARAFAGAHTATAPAEGGFAIDTGEARKTADQYADMLLRARTDGQKHSGVRDLAASLAAQGVKPEMATAIIRSACPVWDENVENLISTAYEKFTPRTLEPSPDAVETNASGVITGLRVQSSAEFLSDLKPAVYVVDGVLAERRCLSLTGYAGHGKTTLALHLAIQVAIGGNFGGMECEQGSVLILAGENPDNVKWQYASAIAAAGLPNDLPIHFLPGHFQLSGYLDALIEKANSIPNLRLVVIDSLQAFFEGENDNGNVEMMEAARRFRKLSDLPAGPSVIVIAHPSGKRPDKSNIVPRGGSSFGNELDGNLTVWAEPDGTQTFHHTEKFRGAPFEPLTFVMEEREFDHLKDHKGRHLRLKVSRQQMIIEAANEAQRSQTRDRDALFAIDGNPRLTIRALAEAIGTSRSTAERVLSGLKSEKLIRRHAKKWVLTEGGKEFLSDV